MVILVTYSSGYGTTREVAEKISEILSTEPSFQLDISSIDEVTGIQPYEAIIIGCSVRADKALANVSDFICAHRNELPKKHLAFFLVCLTANNQEGREKAFREYFSPLFEKYPSIQPIAVEAFGGKIDFDRLNPVMKRLMRRVLEKTGLPTQGNIDTRDWNFITNWAENLKRILQTKEDIKR